MPTHEPTDSIDKEIQTTETPTDEQRIEVSEDQRQKKFAESLRAQERDDRRRWAMSEKNHETPAEKAVREGAEYRQDREKWLAELYPQRTR